MDIGRPRLSRRGTLAAVTQRAPGIYNLVEYEPAPGGAVAPLPGSPSARAASR